MYTVLCFTYNHCILNQVCNNIIVIYSPLYSTIAYIDSYNIIIFDSTYFGKLQLVRCIGVLTIPCQEAPTSKNTSAKLMPRLPLRSARGFAAFSRFNFSIAHWIINIYYTSCACFVHHYSGRDRAGPAVWAVVWTRAGPSSTTRVNTHCE